MSSRASLSLASLQISITVFSPSLKAYKIVVLTQKNYWTSFWFDLFSYHYQHFFSPMVNLYEQSLFML
uniref:Uncharacterized protein n=1 Tax=Pararge aegeria TaxID=116150 RepID=S4NG70_9NEOP